MSEKNMPSTRVVDIVVPVTACQDMSDDQLRAHVATLVHAGEQAAIGQGSREYWEEDPDHPAEDWRYAVSNGDTRHGYWEWVGAQKVEAALDADLPEPRGPVDVGEVAIGVGSVKPRVIVTLQGGLADWVADESVDIVKFDFDAEEDEDWDFCEPIPARFENLARLVDVPVEGDEWPRKGSDSAPKMGL